MKRTVFTNTSSIAIVMLCLSVVLAGCSGAPRMIDESDVPKTTDKHSSFSLMEEIGARMVRSETAQYSVAYDSEYEGERSTLAMYSDGKDSFRMDSVSSGGEVRTYTVKGVQHMCSRNDGGFLCLKSVDVGAKQESLPEIEALRYEDEVAAEEEAAAEHGFRASADGTITVTGHTGDCYAFEYPTYRERLCLSKEGIVLYHAATGSESSPVLQATQYDTRVSTAVFALPEGATIADMDAEGAGMGGAELAQAERTGSCFDACEAQGLSDEGVTACYQTCV